MASGDGYLTLPQSSPVGAAQQSLSFLRGQDAYLKIDPKKTLFAQTAARVSNFVYADVDQTPTTGSIIGSNWDSQQVLSITYPKVADLCSKVALNFLVSGFRQPIFAAGAPSTGVTPIWTEALGYAILQTTKANVLTIGGAPFDYVTDVSCIMEDQLMARKGKRAGEAIGDVASALRFGHISSVANTSINYGSHESGGLSEMRKFSSRNRNIVAQLPLFHTRCPCNALNLVGLQQQDAILNLSLRSRAECCMTVTSTDSTGAISIVAGDTVNAAGFGRMLDFKFTFRMVYLDGPERQYFAQAPMTKLYHPTDFLTVPVNTSSVPSAGGIISNVQLKFNQPCTALMFAFRTDTASTQREHLRFGAYSSVKYTESSSTMLGPQEIVDPISEIAFQVNNNTLFASTTDKMRLDIPNLHGGGQPNRMISLWSFAQDPADDSTNDGSLNFSAIDNPTFSFVIRPVAGWFNTAAVSQAVDGQGYTNILSSGLNVAVADPTTVAPIPAQATGTIFVVQKQINIYRQGGGAIGSLYGS